MGRPLQGYRKLPGGGDNYYTELTVPKHLRDLVGKRKLRRSLGTSNEKTAKLTWAAVYRQLQDELETQVRIARGEEHILRQRIREKITAGYAQHPNLTEIEVAEILTNQTVDHSGETVNLASDVATALTKKKSLALTWEELARLVAVRKETKRGSKLSKGWHENVNITIREAVKFIRQPDECNKLNIRQLRDYLLSTKEWAPITVSNRLTALQGLIQVGIVEDILDLQDNPFKVVDFGASLAESGGRRAFDLKTELPHLLTNAQHGWIFELLCCTGLRIGELMTTTSSDIDSSILVIGKRDEWKPKTQSSYRRVPIPRPLLRALEEALPFNKTRAIGTWKQQLNKEVRRLFDDPSLVVHSTRHTFKTLSRAVGMPADISDEISGHAKTNTSRISDHYGSYPDEVLIAWSNQLHKRLLEVKHNPIT